MRSTRVVLVFSALLVVVACATGIATASGAQKANSRVTLNKHDQFRGQVASSNHRCERSRVVRIFEVRKGPDRHLSRLAETGRWGGWQLLLRPTAPKGEFYVKVQRERFGIDGGDSHVVCRADKSATRTFPR